MSESKEYYRALAEAREFQIDTVLKPAFDLLTVRGIVYGMIADATAYGAKHGVTEKYNQSMDKLIQIDSFLSSCNSVNDHNHQLRLLLRRSVFIRDLQDAKILKLEAELTAIKKAFDAE